MADVLVVGGGSAGCVLAARLSEDPACAVTLLEADADLGDEWHSTQGPVPIRRHPPAELNPVQAAFIEAACGYGLANVADHNRPGAVGADASIMPAIPSANTNLPAIMIAERVTCWITAERREP